MELTNFNLDLSKQDKFQPITAFSTNKNSFLVLIKMKGIVINGVLDLKSIILKLHHLDNDVLYNKIEDVRYGIIEGKHNFYLCMKVSNKPTFDNFKKTKINSNIKLNIGKENELIFHLVYNDCDKYDQIDYGDWPCNTVTAK